MPLPDDHTILVTGGAGYVGAHTVHCLIDSGISPERIVVFDNLGYGHQSFLPAGVIFHHGDLLDKCAIAAVFENHRISGVLHFAAYAYVGESMRDPGKYFENNLLGGIHLLEAMVASGCRRIIFSSSCAAYGASDHFALDESIQPLPLNPYGESKLMFEKMLSWYHRIHGIDAISLRYFNAVGADYGIGERHRPETHLVPLLIQAALGQTGAFTLFGEDYETTDGTCVRDFIHVSDLARAHLSALELLYTGNMCEVVNLGSGEGKSVRQVAQMLQDMSGVRIPIRSAARRPGDPAVLVACNKKAVRLLRWHPRKALAESLESAWLWHQQEMSCTG